MPLHPQDQPSVNTARGSWSGTCKYALVSRGCAVYSSTVSSALQVAARAVMTVPAQQHAQICTSSGCTSNSCKAAHSGTAKCKCPTSVLNAWNLVLSRLLQLLLTCCSSTKRASSTFCFLFMPQSVPNFCSGSKHRPQHLLSR